MMGEFLRDSSNYKKGKVFVRTLDSIKPVKYNAVIWCPDCNGVNFQGCFDGGVERLGPFDTYEEADLVGSEFAGLSIWRYEVEEVEVDESASEH
jgi:hypothetical protein